MVLGDRVELTGAHPGPDGGLRPRRSRRPSTSPEAAHELDLVRRLDLDHASTPLREQRERGYRIPAVICLPSVSVGPRRPGCPASAAPSASRARPVTSSISPMASMRASRPSPLVEPGQRRRLFPVDLEPVPHGLGLVVVALHHLRRRPASAGRRAGGPARPRRRRAPGTQSRPWPRSASDVRSCSAWAMVRGKPSSRNPAFASGSASRSLHHRDGDLVGDEVAGVHVGLGLPAQLRLPAHVGAEDVAGRDRRARRAGRR